MAKPKSGGGSAWTHHSEVARQQRQKWVPTLLKVAGLLVIGSYVLFMLSVTQQSHEGTAGASVMAAVITLPAIPSPPIVPLHELKFQPTDGVPVEKLHKNCPISASTVHVPAPRVKIDALVRVPVMAVVVAGLGCTSADA